MRPASVSIVMTAFAGVFPIGTVELPSRLSRAGRETAEPVISAAPGEDDALWVAAARAGDDGAYRKLVERYRDRIVGLGMRIVHDPQAAEEIAQDAFVRAWQALPDFRGESRFSTWLYRIAYRRALDERASTNRRQGRELMMEADALEIAAPLSERPSDWRLRLRLERHVRSLSDAQRTCITLFYAGDQSIDEIAQVLDLPTGTVKTHLHRARGELRRMWNRDDPKGDLDASR